MAPAQFMMAKSRNGWRITKWHQRNYMDGEIMKWHQQFMMAKSRNSTSATHSLLPHNQIAEIHACQFDDAIQCVHVQSQTSESRGQVAIFLMSSKPGNPARCMISFVFSLTYLLTGWKIAPGPNQCISTNSMHMYI